MDTELHQNDEIDSDSKKQNTNDDEANGSNDIELETQADKKDWFEKLYFMDW